MIKADTTPIKAETWLGNYEHCISGQLLQLMDMAYLERDNNHSQMILSKLSYSTLPLTCVPGYQSR